MSLSKQQILEALHAWIKQRPGLDFANYGDVSSYRSELRQITKDRHNAETLLAAVAMRDSITADALLAGFRAFSGRLQINEQDGKAKLEYCTGQYWPTEYRKAVCAVLASVLWEHVRSHCMPKTNGHRAFQGGNDDPKTGAYDTYDGLSAGDWIRRHFRREFGRSIASRWFQ